LRRLDRSFMSRFANAPGRRCGHWGDDTLASVFEPKPAGPMTTNSPTSNGEPFPSIVRPTVMAPLRVFGLVVLLVVGADRSRAAGGNTASPTFAEILSRVTLRDKATDAIMTVRAKDDAPHRAFALDFTITEVPFAGEAVIVISENLKAGDGVFEKYRLKIDDAIHQELAKQERYAARTPAGAAAEAANTLTTRDANLEVDLALEPVNGEEGGPIVSATLTVRNTGVESRQVQSPDNRRAVTFLVTDSMGNVVSPQLRGKADPATQKAELGPGAELKHKFPRLEFVTGTAWCGYELKLGQTYRVVAVYRPEPGGQGFCSPERSVTVSNSSGQ
jgi:hypothetical protein